MIIKKILKELVFNKDSFNFKMTQRKNNMLQINNKNNWNKKKN